MPPFYAKAFQYLDGVGADRKAIKEALNNSDWIEWGRLNHLRRNRVIYHTHRIKARNERRLATAEAKDVTTGRQNQADNLTTALRLLHDIRNDRREIMVNLKNRWPAFDTMSEDKREKFVSDVVDIMKICDARGPSNIHDTGAARALDFVTDATASEDQIRDLLSTQWSAWTTMSDKQRLDIIAHIKRLGLMFEDIKLSTTVTHPDPQPFRSDAGAAIALEYVDDVPQDIQALKTMLDRRWPAWKKFPAQQRENIAFYTWRILERYGHPENNKLIMVKKFNRALQSKAAVEAGEWLRRKMRASNTDKVCWCIDAEYYIPVNRPHVSPLPLEFAVVELRTGRVLISTLVDYGGATAREIYEELYEENPDEEDENYKRLVSRINKRYGGPRTHGMRPSQIFRKMEEHGFRKGQYEFIGYGLPAFDMTILCNILIQDDAIRAERHKRKDMNQFDLNPVDVSELVKEMLNGGDCGIAAAYARMFSDGPGGKFHTAETDTRALQKILFRLYEALVA